MPTRGFMMDSVVSLDIRSIRIGSCAGVLLARLQDKYDQYVLPQTTKVIGTVVLSRTVTSNCESCREEFIKVLAEAKKAFENIYQEWTIDLEYNCLANDVHIRFKMVKKEKKKMTVAEIEKILGYGVEIVSEV